MQADRQEGRQVGTLTKTDKQAVWQEGGHAGGQAGRQAGSYADRPTGSQSVRKACIQRGSQVVRQEGGHAGRQTGRQAGRLAGWQCCSLKRCQE